MPIHRAQAHGATPAGKVERRMSNFPLRYKLSLLPRLLKPSLGGKRHGFLPAVAALTAPQPALTRRLAFIGDISAVASRTAPIVDARLSALLASADLVIGNCESPVVTRASKRLGTAAGTRHAMTAAFLSDTLAAAGIVRERLVLSLANNHMLDQGIDGFAETQHALATLGIATIGATQDGSTRTIDLDGLSIALAAFTEWRNESRQEFAGRVIMLDDFAADDFAALRMAKADLTCVVAHWDWEFRHFPQPATRALARRLADTGARLVVGNHAHVLQPAERIGATLVAYGLGDFLSTALPRQPWPSRIGAILAVDVSAEPLTKGQLAGYEIVPFFRPRDGARERLVPLDEVAGQIGIGARDRFAIIFAPAGGAP
jgi:poly-gamma-glutamate capsule biosynthesis protein CapA/YwtB (metallophosphatase superfamily)